MGLKFAVIGGGGVRTPLLLRGLTQSDLPVREISIFDPDPVRLRTISSLAQQLCENVPVRSCNTSAECIEGADFVFLSIRVGGISTRAKDEAICLHHGVLGQETVGPGGFAMAMRTIPHVVAYANEISALAPDAWVINFTNPVGIVTQAALSQTKAKFIGICDTPTELFEEVAHCLDLKSAECKFDYFGLNHLGWLREVYCNGAPQLGPLFDRPDGPTRLAGVYRAPLFEPSRLASLRLLPTEYLYYYYRTALAIEHFSQSGETRGQRIEKLNQQLFADLAAAPVADKMAVYERYLAERNAGYMQVESGSAQGLAPTAASAVTGYDRIALAVVHAIHFNTGASLPLDVKNNEILPDLRPDDVVEVPCIVDEHGAHPLLVAPIPENVKGLLGAVKLYERLTVEAALTRSPERACEALFQNPLVNDRTKASQLFSALGPFW